MNIDFGRPFNFVFEDQKWLVKVLIGGVCFFIPIVGGMIVMGYQRRIMLAVAEGNDRGLPEWDQWGEDLVNGLKMFGIFLGYMLPGLFLYIGGSIGGVILAEVAGDEAAIVGMLFSCIGMPLYMLGALIAPVGVLRFVDTGSFGAAFSIGSVIGFVKANAINVLLAILIGMIAGFIAGFGLILLCIGVWFTMAWAMYVQGHAWGQVLRISRAGAGAPAGNVPAYR